MYTIVTGKDKPILRKTVEPVQDFDDNLVKIVEDMKETMLSPNPDNPDVVGVGLAANQVGLDMGLCLVTLNVGKKKDQKILVMVNPEVIEFSKNQNIMEEGCLSLPGDYGKIKRSSKIKAKWQNLDGNWAERKFDGWDARVIQHEVDHLNGKMFIDYL